MPDAAAVGHRWMTYREIAAVLGLPSVKAAEARARRARWRRQPGNDGAARVAVPLFVLEAPRSPRRGGHESPAHGGAEEATPGATSPPSINVLVAELRAAQERLDDRAARLEAERDRLLAELAEARREAATARERAARLEGEGAVLRSTLAAADGRAQRTEDRADQAEARARELEAALQAWTAGGPFERAWRALTRRRIR